MHVDTAARPHPASRALGRLPRRPALLLATLAVAGGVTAAAAVATRGGDGGAAANPTRASAAGISLAQLRDFAGTLGRPLYWAGAAETGRYELTRTKAGAVYVRYLPESAQVGSSNPTYRTVATYPQAHALATIQATAKAQGVRTISLAGGGLAFQDAKRPTSAYLAYPGADVQVEVFDASPGRALELARTGAISAVPLPVATRAPARAATAAGLAALPRTLGHELYWLGAKPGATYELTRMSDGGMYVRYLPTGVSIGDRHPRYVTVGTYPRRGALAALQAAAATDGATTLPVSGGGLAYVPSGSSTSVYVAFPDSNVTVEVFHPDAGQARRLVTSGALVALR